MPLSTADFCHFCHYNFHELLYFRIATFALHATQKDKPRPPTRDASFCSPSPTPHSSLPSPTQSLTLELESDCEAVGGGGGSGPGLRWRRSGAPQSMKVEWAVAAD